MERREDRRQIAILARELEREVLEMGLMEIPPIPRPPSPPSPNEETLARRERARKRGSKRARRLHPET